MQHDLVVAGQHDVDLADRGAALGGRHQRRQGVLRRAGAVAAMGADMDVAGFGRERAIGQWAASGQGDGDGQRSWSEMATPSASTAGMMRGSLQRRPRRTASRSCRRAAAGVPSGRVRCVGASGDVAARQLVAATAQARRTSARTPRAGPAAAGRPPAPRGSTPADRLSASAKVLVLKSPPISTGRPGAMRVDGIEHGAGLHRAGRRARCGSRSGRRRAAPARRATATSAMHGDAPADPALAEMPVEPAAGRLEPGQGRPLQLQAGDDGRRHAGRPVAAGRHARPARGHRPDPARRTRRRRRSRRRARAARPASGWRLPDAGHAEIDLAQQQHVSTALEASSAADGSKYFRRSAFQKTMRAVSPTRAGVGEGADLDGVQAFEIGEGGGEADIVDGRGEHRLAHRALGTASRATVWVTTKARSPPPAVPAPRNRWW